MRRKQHVQYFKPWLRALEYGLLGGRPYSPDCLRLYAQYAGKFLEKYRVLSVENLKDVLLHMPVVHFAKRQKLFAALNCFARYLIQEGHMKPGYLEAAKPFKPKRHLPPRKITVDQQSIEKLLTVCLTSLDRLIIILLSQTGLRAGEAGALKISDINFEKKFLTVRHAKWGKTRRVGISPKLTVAIQEYLAERPLVEHDYLLMNRIHQPIDRSGLRQRLERLGIRAGIPVHPHALRRAFVTINANLGRPLVMLQIACGHNDIATTRSYCMTTEDEVIQAMTGWEW